MLPSAACRRCATEQQEVLSARLRNESFRRAHRTNLPKLATRLVVGPSRRLDVRALRGRLRFLRNYMNDGHTRTLSAQPADHVHLDPARQAWRQCRDYDRVVAATGQELIINRRHGICIPDPDSDNPDAFALQRGSRRLHTGSCHFLCLSLLPSQKITDRGCGHEESELRMEVLRHQFLCGVEQLLTLGRLMSNEQVLRHGCTPRRSANTRIWLQANHDQAAPATGLRSPPGPRQEVRRLAP